MKVTRAFNLIYDEVQRARREFPPLHGPHEGYAVIKEEFDEFWNAIKSNDSDQTTTEAIHTAAMLIRYLVDISKER